MTIEALEGRHRKLIATDWLALAEPVLDERRERDVHMRVSWLIPQSPAAWAGYLMLIRVCHCIDCIVMSDEP